MTVPIEILFSFVLAAILGNDSLVLEITMKDHLCKVGP